MTNTMERGKVVGLSDEVIAKMRQRFADECKRMLEGMAEDTECIRGVGRGSSAEHQMDCPVAVFQRAAHSVWLWGQP
jgi:conjugative relaxase-like TrwC/TraI family protein